MDYLYLITPFVAWLAAGILKFIVNSVRARKLAFKLIGYGGFPSNHSTIVSSMATLIALREGISHPAFGVAITVAFIVILDASSLRRQVGFHAQTINRLSEACLSGDQDPPLRERMGHTKAEILAGIVLGVLVATTVCMIGKS